MTLNREFADDVAVRLMPLGPVAHRRMFGGFGIFLDGLMFGLIADDTLYLKADDVNRETFAAAGSAPFQYDRRGRPVEMSYWRVPETVFDDLDALIDWAESALQAAKRTRRPRRRRSP